MPEHFIHRGPEVRKQGGRIVVDVWTHAFKPMPVVKRVCGLRAPSRQASYRMCVVESNQPLAAGPMKRKRIIQTVRPGLRSGYTPHNEPHPIPAFWIDNEDLPVKIEQCIQRWITRHLLSLSDTDNHENNAKRPTAPC